MALSNLVSIGPGNGLAPFGAKPLPEPMLTYHQLDPHKQTNLCEIWITKIKTNIIQEKGRNVICRMPAILSRPQCVNIPVLKIAIHSILTTIAQLYPLPEGPEMITTNYSYVLSLI